MSQEKREEESSIMRDFGRVLFGLAVGIASLAVITLDWKFVQWLTG